MDTKATPLEALPRTEHQNNDQNIAMSVSTQELPENAQPPQPYPDQEELHMLPKTIIQIL